jgi:hypothetical protein
MCRSQAQSGGSHDALGAHRLRIAMLLLSEALLLSVRSVYGIKNQRMARVF